MRNMVIAALAVTLIAGGFITIVTEMEDTYGTTVATAAEREQLENIEDQRERISSEVQQIQGFLNNIQEGDYLNAFLGAPGAIVSTLKIMLIEVPIIIHETVSHVFVMLHLPQEVVYAFYLGILILVVWSVYGVWSKESV